MASLTQVVVSWQARRKVKHFSISYENTCMIYYLFVFYPVTVGPSFTYIGPGSIVIKGVWLFPMRDNTGPCLPMGLANISTCYLKKRYALPTKSTEVMVMPEQGTKMYVDAILKTHERIVQFSQLNATLCPIFMEVMLKNQPEGVQLSVKPHTEADYQARFKARPELEGLMAQIT
ncbi:large ribosomal subunit protein mL48 isoform 3-T3 [Salvelinus alpinus]